MAGGMVGADADALDAAAARLRAASAELDQYESWLTSSLYSVSWLGTVASAFLHAWSGTHRVRLQSTADFVREAADVLQKQARDQRRTSAASGGGSGRGGSSGRNDPPSGSPTVPVDDIFSTDYMEGFVGTEPRGAGEPELNDALEDLMNDPDADPARVNELLDEIARIRGVDPAALRVDYQRYLDLRAQMIADGHHIEPVDLGRHPDFLGSLGSLRYGSIVGDALGIDPVFGALLNPTGGLVGPGNRSIKADPSTPIGYHGQFHDAAGFLYTKFGSGPGYAYVPGDNGDPSNPLSGQIKGTRYWAQMSIERRIEIAQDWAGDRIDDAQDWAGDRIDDGRRLVDAGKDKIGDGIDAGKKKLSDGWNALEGGWERVW